MFYHCNNLPEVWDILDKRNIQFDVSVEKTTRMTIEVPDCDASDTEDALNEVNSDWRKA